MNGLENVDEVLALSPIQDGMLYHSVSQPGQGVFVTQIALDIYGDLRPERLRSAWEGALRKHAALRTSFLWDGLDEPVQVVARNVELDWHVIDLPPDFDRWLAEDRLRGFDLSSAPLMRHVLMQTNEGWRLVWTFHHILLDGWSANIVLRDVLSLLSGRDVKGSSGYGRFLDAVHASDCLPFWKDRVGTRDTETILSDPLLLGGSGHEHIRKSLSIERTDALRKFARDNRITLNTLVLGAWARCIASAGDDEEPLFGTTVSTRPDSIDGIEEAVGVYINTLPFSVRIDDSPVRSWLQALQKDQQKCQAQGFASLSEIKQVSSLPKRTAFFDSIVVFENHAAAEEGFEDALAGTGLEARIVAFVDQSNYPLALLAIPGEQLGFELVYDTQYFSRGFALAVMDAVEHVLDGFLSTPEKPVAQIPIARVQVPASAAETVGALLPELISSHRSPHPAVVGENRTISYEQLDCSARKLAGALIENGAEPGDVIGLYAGRGVDFVTGMLAILKAGMAFAPLDPDYPNAYLSEVAKNAGLRVAIASPGLENEAQAFAGTVLTSDMSDAKASIPVSMDDPAYVIHTSGSQGQPKGVVVSHGNIAYSTAVRRDVYGDGPSRFLLMSPVAFDSAMVGLLWTLAEGGTLVLPDPGQEKDIAAIADLIQRERITHLLCIPSLWHVILDFAEPVQLAGLNTVIVAGEACPPDLPRLHGETLPGVRLFNEYGPTEASVWCIAGEIGGSLNPVPIGSPIPGTAVYLMDRWQQPVPDGIPGEIFVSGPGVAQGYLDLPEATQQRFVDDPFRPGMRMYRTGDLGCRRQEGEYFFLGRIDEQIKINGYRIEPGEIAACLSDYPGISSAQVLLVAANDPALLACRLAALPADEAEDLMSRIAP